MYRREEQELHERLVEKQIRGYQKEGTKILAADFGDWPRPPKVGRHIPDIVAERDGRRIYNECETCETMATEQTREQLEDFGKAGILEVTVPESWLEAAKRLAASWGISVYRWWHLPGV